MLIELNGRCGHSLRPQGYSNNITATITLTVAFYGAILILFSQPGELFANLAFKAPVCREIIACLCYFRREVIRYMSRVVAWQLLPKMSAMPTHGRCRWQLRPGIALLALARRKVNAPLLRRLFTWPARQKATLSTLRLKPRWRMLANFRIMTCRFICVMRRRN